MKKLLVYLCIGVLTLGLAACGADDSTTPSADNQSTVEETPAPTQSPETTEAPQSTEGPEATQSPQQDTVGVTLELSGIKQAVIEVIGEENYFPETEMSVEYFEEFGLTADMCDGFWGETPLISTHVDTIVVVHAKEDQVEEVETALSNYRERLVSDGMQYPMNVGKVQASRIETFGNYVCFVQLGGDVDPIYTANGSDEDVIKHCQVQNELALEAIGKAIDQ